MTIGSNFQIGQCVQNLPNKFGDRQDANNILDGSKPITAVMEAIKELTETYEFEELKYQTPVPPSVPLNLTAGNAVIPLSTVLGTIAGNTVYPQFQTQNVVDITDCYDSWMWFAGGVNQAGRILKYRRIPTIDTYSYGITNNKAGQLGVAPPVYYSRFGNMLQVGPVPDNNYQYFLRIKLRHPFPIGGVNAFVPATFSVTLSGSSVSAITVTNSPSGFGYPVNSTGILVAFAIAGTSSFSGVTSASAIATSNSLGQIVSVSLVSGGSGYPGTPTAGTAQASMQQVFMPDSWQEIVELCACQRLALWEGAREYMEYFEDLLKTKGIDISEARKRKAQMVRDELHNERQMSLMVGPYTWA